MASFINVYPSGNSLSTVGEKSRRGLWPVARGALDCFTKVKRWLFQQRTVEWGCLSNHWISGWSGNSGRAVKAEGAADENWTGKFQGLGWRLDSEYIFTQLTIYDIYFWQTSLETIFLWVFNFMSMSIQNFAFQRLDDINSTLRNSEKHIQVHKLPARPQIIEAPSSLKSLLSRAFAACLELWETTLEVTHLWARVDLYWR